MCVLFQDLKEKKLSDKKDVKLVRVEDALQRIKLSENRNRENEKDKKGKEVDLDKKNLILKMDVVKNVFVPYQKIEKPVYAKYLRMFVKLNFLHRVVNFVVVMVAIQETSMTNMNTHLINTQIIK